MFSYKIKLAIRNLLKNKVYSALIIGGFSIGFTAFILIALFYNTEHNVNTDFADYKQIYRVYDAKENYSGLDYNFNAVLVENYPEVKNACPVEYVTGFKMTVKDDVTKNFTQVEDFMITTNNFFEIFSVKMLSGLSDKPFNTLNSIVITESLAKRLFGYKDPLGRTIKNEFLSGVVSAVIEELPSNSSFKGEMFLNSENKEFQMSQACNNGICVYPTNHFLVLAEDIDPIVFTQKLNSTIKEYNTNVQNLAIQPLKDIYLSKLDIQDDTHKRGSSKTLLIFLSIGVLIILLSSVNYLNYTILMQ